MQIVRLIEGFRVKSWKGEQKSDTDLNLGKTHVPSPHLDFSLQSVVWSSCPVNETFFPSATMVAFLQSMPSCIESRSFLHW